MLHEMTYVHGGFRMIIKYFESYAQVAVYDLSSLRFPLRWSKAMSKTAARGAHELFEAIGYFDMPV